MGCLIPLRLTPYTEYNEASISVSSDSSDDSNSNLDASNDLAAAEDEDTDVDTDDSDEGVEQRPAKRPCSEFLLLCIE